MAALLPSCCITCVMKGLSNPLSMITDSIAVCTNFVIQMSLWVCLLASCNSTELCSTVSSRKSASSANPRQEIWPLQDNLYKGVSIESRQVWTEVIGLIFGSLALGAVMLRCFSHVSITNSIQMDDWMIIMEALIVGALMVIDTINVQKGFGLHTWNVDPRGLIFWCAEMLYVGAIALLKIYILIFYASIRLMGSAVAYAIIVRFFIVFQCAAIHAVCDRNQPKRCIDINALKYATAATSVAQDMIILIMREFHVSSIYSDQTSRFAAIPQIVSLNMSMKQKLNLIFMFSLGLVFLKRLAPLAAVFDPLAAKPHVAWLTMAEPLYQRNKPTVEPTAASYGPRGEAPSVKSPAVETQDTFVRSVERSYEHSLDSSAQENIDYGSDSQRRSSLASLEDDLE
ncbi:hypothetical protein BJ878DRAFT_477442 [Calycina marina]|uniref:Rhodopsin domain-containing protein n=1 Tax=Calycina marina TaxID=1763456 RepID=A0A9P7Z9H2_9HELO|nr:hypothetical protein BJ878DRAFT_477442 [Calycina marina]